MQPDEQLFSALSYRTPMQVNEARKLASGEEYPRCPRCCVSLEREYMQYCSHCGQALGWRRWARRKIAFTPSGKQM